MAKTVVLQVNTGKLLHGRERALPTGYFSSRIRVQGLLDSAEIAINLHLRMGLVAFGLRGCGEMVDAPDLGSGAARRGGSSPSTRTRDMEKDD